MAAQLLNSPVVWTWAFPLFTLPCSAVVSLPPWLEPPLAPSLGFSDLFLWEKAFNEWLLSLLVTKHTRRGAWKP